MVQATIDEESFIEMYRRCGASQTARQLGLEVRTVHKRRALIEKRRNIRITAPEINLQIKGQAPSAPEVASLEIKNGVALIGSDSHYLPENVSTAHLAMLHFAKVLKPKVVILNGDVLDGGRISRHAPIGWEDRPQLIDELEACQDRLAEIEYAAPRGCRKFWTLGNHDARFETRIATIAPEYAKVHGVHLKDHFPRWENAWAVAINHVRGQMGGVVVTHRWKSGMHAPHNNTLWAGVSYVTGHLHSLKIQPISDYHGTRWGVDSGTMADPYGPQFINYTEANPVNWRSGLVVLTFKDGVLLWPELIHVVDLGVVNFRGELITVADKAKAGVK